MILAPTKISYITEEFKVPEALSDLLRFDVLGWDSETTSLSPHDGRMRLSQFAKPDGHTYVFDLWKVNPAFHRIIFAMRNLLLIGQHIKFDCKFLMKECHIYKFPDLFDTMLGAQLCAEGQVGEDAGGLKFNLNAISNRFLEIEVDKEEQVSDWSRNELSASQIEYAAKDAFVMHPLRAKILEKLRIQSQVRVAELEFSKVPAVAAMELDGFHLNGTRWEQVFYETQKKALVLEDKLWDYFALRPALFGGVPTLNLNSHVQVKEAFHKKGIEVPVSRDGKETLGKDALDAISKKTPEVAWYLEYKKHIKNMGSFGLSWLPMIHPVTGMIHSSYKEIGAETGRFSNYDPNLQQVPVDPEYRSCFDAPEGWFLIDADYSQCELRIAAELCRDENLIKAFDLDEDLHRWTASLLFKVALEKVTKAQRSIAKNQNFRIGYGGGPMGLADATGITFDEAVIIVDLYMNQAYPKFRDWLNWQANNTVRTMVATTMTGRRRLYWGDISDKTQKASIERNGKNLPIQGTNADITKRAMALVHQEIAGHPFIKFSHVVHDEIILRSTAKYIDEAKRILVDCMYAAEREYLKRVPSKVDCDVTLYWAKEVTQEHKDLVKQKRLEYA